MNEWVKGSDAKRIATKAKFRTTSTMATECSAELDTDFGRIKVIYALDSRSIPIKKLDTIMVVEAENMSSAYAGPVAFYHGAPEGAMEEYGQEALDRFATVENEEEFLEVAVDFYGLGPMAKRRHWG